MVVIAQVVNVHAVHLPRLHVDVLDNGTQLMQVEAFY